MLHAFVMATVPAATEITTLPFRPFASVTAARIVHLPAASAQMPSPGLASFPPFMMLELINSGPAARAGVATGSATTKVNTTMRAVTIAVIALKRLERRGCGSCFTVLPSPRLCAGS